MVKEWREAAFFDLDRTLIDVNSAVLFARFEREAKRISTWQLLSTISNTLLYHFNMLDVHKAYEKALKHYRGLEETELDARTRAFFERDIRSRLQPGARLALDEHRQAGRPLVMLSTSSCYQADAATKAWGLDDWIANRFGTKEGRLDGRIQRPLCYGPGKVELARRWAEENRVDISQSWFYSDSFSDLPMLKEVKYPVIVNPDPKLKAYAQRANWPIVNWQLPASGAQTKKGPANASPAF